MPIDRRRALSLMMMGSVAAPVAAGARPRPDASVSFLHGVASGDPQADRVILWTRARPASGQQAVSVAWEVGEDEGFRRIAARGQANTGPERDWTVKVDASGLQPGREYWYRFRAGAAVSPVGRTKTLPSGSTDKVVLAVVTCALYPAGYFNAYDHLAKSERLDAVVELGDYIYEYGAGEGAYGMETGRKLGRIPEPAHDIVTLADYRARYAQYRREPELQAAHARAPWICVWDDHEVCNDTWMSGAENHHADRQGGFAEREATAIRAYFEWMPIREPAPGQASAAIYRSFQFGDLASLVMLESRLLARSRQLEYEVPGDIPLAVYQGATPETRRKVTDAKITAEVLTAAKAGTAPKPPYVIGPDVEAIKTFCADPARQMLGPAQEAWLGAELKASVQAGRPWQVLGNQVVMAKMINPDAGAVIGRDRLAALIAARPEGQRKRLRRLADTLTYPAPYDLDGWNGYPAARERIYDRIRAAGEANVIVLAGDSHAFWANQLVDAGGQKIAVELGTSSITSPSIGDAAGFQVGQVFQAQNPEVTFCDQLAKGYIRLTLTPTEALGEMIAVTTLERPYKASTLATWRVKPTAGPGAGVLERV